MRSHVLQKIAPFALAFGLSVLLVAVLGGIPGVDELPVPPPPPSMEPVGHGWGSGSGPGTVATTPFKITHQPKARYTDEARANDVEGAVRLKITLQADGTVGSIVPVTRLPHGLTEMAIAAARQIRFEPKLVNGKPVSVVVTREYTFSIY